MNPRFPFPAYPNGWFALGFTPEFPEGEVVTRHAFGQDIVVYRTRDGLRSSDPHCPHLGAHFGFGGRVIDDKLRCPFHGWCFDAAGQCVDIPGAIKIPPKAKLRSWPMREQNGVVFAHYDAEGQPPEWGIPMLPDDGWTPNQTVLWTVRSHPQEILENTVDSAHLIPVHAVNSATICRAPVEEGPMFNVALNLIADGAIVNMPGTVNDVVLDVTMHGLGFLVSLCEVRNVGLLARQRIYCTPIDEERTEIRGVVNLQKFSDDATDQQVAELFYQAYVYDFALDFPIWENKVYRDKPILSNADGPFMTYRKWARQFYSGGVKTAVEPLSLQHVEVRA